VDIVDEFGSQHERFPAARRVESPITVAKAEHIFHAVAVMQFQKQRANDVVQAGA